MTEELFRGDAALDTCNARITALGEAGIELDRAMFYPQGARLELVACVRV